MVMGIPDFSVDPHRDLLRNLIEARSAYERLCGFAPKFVHVNGPIKAALEKRGMKEGSEVAGMRIIASPESIADMAICSRDEDLFKPLPVVSKPLRSKAKK
jgi:hypothetical protein